MSHSVRKPRHCHTRLYVNRRHTPSTRPHRTGDIRSIRSPIAIDPLFTIINQSLYTFNITLLRLVRQIIHLQEWVHHYSAACICCWIWVIGPLGTPSTQLSLSNRQAHLSYSWTSSVLALKSHMPSQYIYGKALYTIYTWYRDYDFIMFEHEVVTEFQL